MTTADKKLPPDAFRDPNLELAREIFVGMATRIYSAPSSPEQKKPDPKALAMLCFRLAEAFDAASKAAVKLDEVDLTHVFKPAETQPEKK